MRRERLLLAALLVICVVQGRRIKKNSSRIRAAACGDMLESKDAIVAAEHFLSTGQSASERACWERAAELDEDNHTPLVRLGNMAHVDGKLESARSLLEQARMLAPSDSYVHSSIAGIEYSGKRFHLAVIHYQLALSVPGGLTVHNLNNLGISYSAVKDWSGAERTYRLALRLWGERSRGAQGASLPTSAVSVSAALHVQQAQAQQLASHAVSVMLNLGNAYVETRRFSDATQVYQHMLRLAPAYAVGHYSLGRAYDRARDSSKALRSYQRALDFDPHLPNAYSNMGVLYLNEQRPADAVGVLQVLERLKPSTSDLNNLGDALGDTARYTEAIAAYQRALDHAQRETGARFYPKALYSMLHYLIHTCSWDELRRICVDLEATIERELSEGLETGITPIEALVLLGTYTHHSLLRKVTYNFALRSMLRAKEAGHARLTRYVSRKRGAPVRLGYMSGGLRLHPDGKNLQGVFAQHARAKVEVFCLSLKRDGGSSVEQKLKSTCHNFVDYTDLDNYAVAKAVNELGIHVLLDVNGYTGEGVRSQRNIILALTPAPVQVNFLAWVASSGAPFMHYLISDAVASPPEFAGDYSEKLVVFPSSYFPTDLRQSGGTIAPPATRFALQRERQARGLPRSGVLVSGFNQLWKIDEALFRAWLAVINATAAPAHGEAKEEEKPATAAAAAEEEAAVYLWLPLFPDVARPNLLKMAEEVLGKEAAGRRIIWTPLFGEDHLEVKALAELQLDTYVYCGHTSGADILWAGVPTLTLPGIKQTGKTHAPLFDMRLWTAAMEAAVRMMWEMEELGSALGSAASATKHVIVNRAAA